MIEQLIRYKLPLYDHFFIKRTSVGPKMASDIGRTIKLDADLVNSEKAYTHPHDDKPREVRQSISPDIMDFNSKSPNNII